MSADRFVDLFIQLGLKETYWANLGVSVRRLRIFLLAFALLAVFTGTAFVLAHVGAEDDNFQSIGSNLAPLFWVWLVILIIFPAVLWFTTRKALRDPRTQGGFHYRISDAGIESRGSAGSTELNWSAFIAARETTEAFQLFISGSRFHFLPKRCFASPQEIDLAREIIRANISKAKLSP
jgi:hypothetical protein